MSQRYADGVGRSLSDRILFVGFLGLVLWAPLPLGSNRPWAVAILEVWAYALSAWWLCGYAFGLHAPTSAFRRAWPALSLLALWLLYLTVHVVPLPLAFVEWISPEAARMHLLGALSGAAPQYASLSVDVDAGR